MENKILLDIIMPTKNRGKLLEPAFDALKKQTDKNFQLIVIDNSDDDKCQEVKDTIKIYENDFKIKYVKSGGLTMVENWEFAYSVSESKYSYLSTDKILLAPDTVKIFNEGFKQFPNENIFTFSRENPCKFKNWTLCYSKDLISETLDNMNNFLKMCTGSELKICISKTLKDEIIEKYGKLITYMAGDIDVVFIALMNCETFCRINYHAASERNVSIGSIGYSGYYKSELYKNYINDCHTTIEELSKDAPIHVSNNWNGIYNNMFKIAKLTKYPCNISMINKIQYWTDLFSFILYEKRFFQLDRSNDFLKMYEYLEKEALLFDPIIQQCMNYYVENPTAHMFNEPFNINKKQSKHKVYNILGIKIKIKRRRYK